MQQQVWATYMTIGLYRAPSRVFDCSSTLSLRTGQGVCESRSSWRRARACPLTCVHAFGRWRRRCRGVPESGWRVGSPSSGSTESWSAKGLALRAETCESVIS